MILSIVMTFSAAFAGAIVVPILTERGLRELRWTGALPRWRRAALTAAGAASSLVSLASADHWIGSAVLPVLLVWGWALVALAGCDALTQRIPTPMVRQSTAVVCMLLVGSSVARDEWHPLFIGMAGATVAGGVLLAAWRVASTGMGDVRLAVLGGLGMGSATATSLLAGIAVWAGFLAVQTTVTLARGGSFSAPLPLGPGLSAGFLVAAHLPS